MLVGDASTWLTELQDVEDRIVARLPSVWPICVANLSADALEDRITRQLVCRLRQDPEARAIGAIHSQFELLEEQRQGDVTPKGYLDIAVVLGSDVDRYVAFECKRLNVTRRGKVISLSGLYVKQGMMRYVHAQYAERLPFGAMLGFAMDGDAEGADVKVRRSIGRRSRPLRLTSPPSTSIIFGPVRRFETVHQRKLGSKINIRHAILSF